MSPSLFLRPNNNNIAIPSNRTCSHTQTHTHFLSEKRMKTVVAILLLVGSLVDAKCYLPDGTGATNPQWRECSNDPQDPLSNICCALNRKNPAGGLRSEGDTADTCMPNGLCQNEAVSDAGVRTTTYRRAYCTSQEWESGKCLTTCGKGVRSSFFTSRFGVNRPY